MKRIISLIFGLVLFSTFSYAAQVAVVQTDNRQEAWAKETLNNSDLQTNIDGKEDTLANSAGLARAISDETGTGVVVFGTSPVISTPTGIVKGDVGLGNVDNTSDATKNAAAVTLTNKTLTSPVLTTPDAGTPSTIVLTNATDMPSDEVKVPEIGTATYDDMQDIVNFTGSSGRISGWALSDGGSGTVDISAGKGYIRTSDSELAPLVPFDMASTSALALTDNDNNWVYVNYNSGTPIYGVTLDILTLNFNDEFLIGQVYRVGSTVHIVAAGPDPYNTPYRLARRHFDTDGMQRYLGIVTTEVGTRQLSMTSGSAYYGTTITPFAAIDTSGAGTFTTHYRSSGSWASTAGQTAVDYLQYDDGTDLANIGNAKYGVHWVYKDYNSGLHLVYGTVNDSLGEAIDALLPSALPDFISSFSFRIAKIIVAQNNSSSLQDVVNEWDHVFGGSVIINHNDNGNIQGGNIGIDQAYHQDLDQHTISTQPADTTNSGYLDTDDWDTFNDKVTNANHSGDATGATVLTLATVNSNVGSFTNADITVNAKGLVTAAANGSGGSGDVTGPGSSTDNAIAVYDSTTGKLIKDSTVTIVAGELTAPGGLNAGASATPSYSALDSDSLDADKSITRISSNATTVTAGAVVSDLIFWYKDGGDASGDFTEAFRVTGASNTVDMLKNTTLQAGDIELAELATDSVDYTKTTGSFKALAQVKNTPANFLSTFTGENLRGGHFITTAAGNAVLPPVVVGMIFSVTCDAAELVDFDPDATGTEDTIILNTATLGYAIQTQGEKINNGTTSGAMCVFEYSEADTWLATCTDSWTGE